jgi:hypothetical protein
MPGSLIFKRCAYWQYFFIPLSERLIHEESSLHHSGNLYHRMVLGRFCMERNRPDQHPDYSCRYFVVIWTHPKSIGFSIQSFSYTRSILSARLQFSTVAIFIFLLREMR